MEKLHRYFQGESGVNILSSQFTPLITEANSRHFEFETSPYLTIRTMGLHSQCYLSNLNIAVFGRGEEGYTHKKKIWKFIFPPDVSVGVGSRKALRTTWWPITVQADTANLGVVPALWWPNWKAFGPAMVACSDPAGTLRPEGALQMSPPFQLGPVAGTPRRTLQEETLSARLTEGRATNAIQFCLLFVKWNIDLTLRANQKTFRWENIDYLLFLPCLGIELDK